jgi:hypothetical protein
MHNQMDIVRDVSERLDALQIPFMLTGSLAMNFYAPPRMTRDIDFVLDLKPGDAPRLVAALETDYYIVLESVQSALRLQRQFNVIHTESVIKVDCIVRKDSEFARAEFARRQPLASGNLRTTIVSKEDLILAKLAWARHSRSETQLKDVSNLLARGYDREYVEWWADRLALRDLLEECRRE